MGQALLTTRYLFGSVQAVADYTRLSAVLGAGRRRAQGRNILELAVDCSRDGATIRSACPILTMDRTLSAVLSAVFAGGVEP
jgi:hypothetical protein